MQQDGDRLGSPDAPVSIQFFDDLQCSSCREDFLGTSPPLTESNARPGSVKLLYRHYSVSESPLEDGFYGAEAAAAQGYAWPYIYLFFRNQNEAVRFGIDQDFLESIAGGIEELNFPEWKEYLEENGGSDGAIAKQLEGLKNSAPTSASAPARPPSSPAPAAPRPSRTAPRWLESNRRYRQPSSCSQFR